MDILYLATNTTVPEWFAQIAEPQGLCLIPYSAKKTDLTKAEAVLLFSPFHVQEQYLSPDVVWKKYCQEEYPNLKIVTASFAVQPAENCLELSALPENLAAFFETALPAKTEPDWQPADTGGLNMMDVLRRFFNGHGTESLMKEFGILYRPAHDIRVHIQLGTPHETIRDLYLRDGNLVQRWKAFLSRWNRYFPMFEGLPFYPKFQEVALLIEKTDSFFQKNSDDLDLYAQIGCDEAIEAIRTNLKSIIPYVDGVN
ncbi:MAG: hypothetical protein ACKVT2_19930 [Saprospiraceae bacterium]